jgi:hypothetical protein
MQREVELGAPIALGQAPNGGHPMRPQAKCLW